MPQTYVRRPSTGKWLDPNPASDGETYFATALYMAAARWSIGSYADAANNILEVATNKTGSVSMHIKHDLKKLRSTVPTPPTPHHAQCTHGPPDRLDC